MFAPSPGDADSSDWRLVDDVDDKEMLLRCRPGRRNAAAFDRRILTTAEALFAERGVAAVSMHQIALAAGVGQGTLYRRYANKGELCLDLLSDNGCRLQEDVEAFLSVAEKGALERLDGLLVRLVAFEEANGDLLGAVVDASCGERRDMQFRNPLVQWLHRAIAHLLEQAVAEEELPPLDVVFTADALLSALAVDRYLFQRRERGFSPERILQGVRRIFVDGLRTGPAAVPGA